MNTSSPLVVVELTSMLPTLREGDLLLLKGTDDPSQIESGTIIVFNNPNPPPPRIVHRVIDFQTIDDQVHFITKGDNNPIQDPPVRGDHVIGIVIIKIPRFLSNYILFTDSLPIKLLMVFFVAIIISLDLYYTKRSKLQIPSSKNQSLKIMLYKYGCLNNFIILGADVYA